MCARWTNIWRCSTSRRPERCTVRRANCRPVTRCRSTSTVACTGRSVTGARNSILARCAVTTSGWKSSMPRYATRCAHIWCPMCRWARSCLAGLTLQPSSHWHRKPCRHRCTRSASVSVTRPTMNRSGRRKRQRDSARFTAARCLTSMHWARCQRSCSTTANHSVTAPRWRLWLSQGWPHRM